MSKKTIETTENFGGEMVAESTFIPETDLSVDNKTDVKQDTKKKEPAKSENKVIVTNLTTSTVGFRLAKGCEYRLEPGETAEIDSAFSDSTTITTLEQKNVLSVKRS